MNPEDPKLIVALYLRGEQLDPDAVSRVLAIRPSRAQTKGQRLRTSTGHEFEAKVGLWSLVVELQSSSLEAHLAQLLSTLPPVLSLSSIADVEEAYIDVFLALASDRDGEARCELDVSPSTLRRLSELGLPVRLSVTAGPD